jgi:hypothetical protein
MPVEYPNDWKCVYDSDVVKEMRTHSQGGPLGDRPVLGRRVPRLLFAVIVAGTIALGGCGESADAGSKGETSSVGGTASVPHVSLHLDVGSFSSDSASATISGTVTPGSKVTVNSHRAAVHGHRWSEALALHLGGNRVTVAATHDGRHPVRKTITITREKSAAEVEAQAHAKETESEPSEGSTPNSTAGPSAEECTNGTYVNSAGNTVCRPEDSPTVPAGATAECKDGTYSFSQSRSGTCSYHGGVARWLE